MASADDDYELQLALAMSASLNNTPADKPSNSQESAFFSDQPLASSGHSTGATPNFPSAGRVRTSGFLPTASAQPVMGADAKMSTNKAPSIGIASKVSAKAAPTMASPPLASSAVAAAAAKKETKSMPYRANASAKAEGSSNSNSNRSSSNSSDIVGPIRQLIASHIPYCAQCNCTIGLGAFVNALGKKYHKECFRCVGCGAPINGQFVPHGNPAVPYHQQCAQELFSPRCSLCSCAISGRFMRHPYFEQEMYCGSHEDRPSCCACGRREPLKESMREPFTNLSDGRSLCSECVSTVIMDSSEAQALYLKIVDLMEYSLGFTIPPGMRDIPVLVVDVKSLNDNNSSSFHAGMISGQTVRGMTLSNLREVRHFAVRGMPSSMYKVEQVRAVSAILVLYGLPSDLAGSIIAHEAMHAWIKLNKQFPFFLEPKVEEGLCQVMADKFLEMSSASVLTAASDRMSDNEFDKMKREESLRIAFRRQIADDSSEVYGEGFREANKCSERLGLFELLNYIRTEKRMPKV